MIRRHNRLEKCRQESIKLVVVAASLRTEELVSGGDALGRKSILGTVSSSGGGNGLGNIWMILFGELLGRLILLVSSGDSDDEGHMS